MSRQVVGMILAGGRVDELSVLTAKRPKSAVPIWGMYRVIDFVLSNMMHSRVEVVGVLSQYRPYSLISHLDNGSPWDYIGRRRELKILSPFQGMFETDWYRGTADAVYQNLNFLRHYDPELVLIAAGDHVYSMDYRPLIRRHLESRADLTIAFKRVPLAQAHLFGTAVLDGDGRVLSYQEKTAEPESDLASLTVYVFNADVLTRRVNENAREGRSFHIYSEIIPRMVAEGDRVFGHVFDGYWAYARTLDAYYHTSMSILEADGPDVEAWQVCTNLRAGSRGDPPPALFGGGARVGTSLLCAGATVSGTVERSIVGPWSVIEEGAVVRDSVLMDGCVVGAAAVLDRAILDKHVSVGAGAVIGHGDVATNTAHAATLSCGATVVGKFAEVPAGTRVGRNCVIAPDLKAGSWPGREIAAGATVTP